MNSNNSANLGQIRTTMGKRCAGTPKFPGYFPAVFSHGTLICSKAHQRVTAAPVFSPPLNKFSLLLLTKCIPTSLGLNDHFTPQTTLLPERYSPHLTPFPC